MNKIYWHKVIFLDEELAKKYSNTNYKLGECIGLDTKESNWQIWDEDVKDIVIIAKFKYMGITYKTGDSKQDLEEFKKLKNKFNVVQKDGE